MYATKLKRLLIPVALVIPSLALAVLIVLGVDRALGRWIEDPRLTAGLLFPPQMEVAFKSYEYTFTARTNSLGLRDTPYDPRYRPKVLVAAIGDSFTFGHGVELDQVWAQRVEKNLRAKGLDVEILNFGQPGSYPPYYASLAEAAFPIVKPDLVLVNLLQSDDIPSIDPKLPDPAPSYRRDPWMRTQLRAWFPNLTDLAYRERAHQLADREKHSQDNWSLMRFRWKEDFQKVFNEVFDESAKQEFRRLPAPVRQAFRNGELQPLLALMCVETWRVHRQEALDWKVESEEMQSRIEIAARSLSRIQHAIAPWEGRVVVLSLPSMNNTDPFGSKIWHDLFGTAESLVLTDTRADEAIHQTAKRAGLPSHDVTAAFRSLARAEPLFFPLDLHLNPRGNDVLADLMTPVIEGYVRQLAER